MGLPTPTECIVCGGEVQATNVRGQVWPYRDLVDLRVEEDVLLPACGSCGEMMLNDADTRRLGEALERAYEVRRQGETQRLIEAITRDLSLTQGEIEQILGMSGGYISKAKRHEKVLSTQAYRFLFVLHEEPGTTVKTLARLDPRLSPLADRIAHLEHGLLPG